MSKGRSHLPHPHACCRLPLEALPSEPQVPCMCVGRWLIFPLTDCYPCCRPSSATAAFLVSLYIKDIWLGAQRPESLLTHVRMVLDATEDRQAGDEEPIIRLCRDLTAAAPDA